MRGGAGDPFLLGVQSTLQDGMLCERMRNERGARREVKRNLSEAPRGGFPGGVPAVANWKAQMEPCGVAGSPQRVALLLTSDQGWISSGSDFSLNVATVIPLLSSHAHHN